MDQLSGSRYEKLDYNNTPISADASLVMACTLNPICSHNSLDEKREQGYNFSAECSFLYKFPLPPTVLSHVQPLQHSLSYQPRYIIRQTKKKERDETSKGEEAPNDYTFTLLPSPPPFYTHNRQLEEKGGG